MKIVRAVFIVLSITLVATIFAAAQALPVTFHQQAVLTASDGAASDFLGTAVAMSVDTLVAGAPQEGANTGKAEVFVEPPGGWTTMTQTAELKPSDGVPGMGFGYRLAISGDTIIVNTVDGPAVYVFVKPTSGWTDMTETAQLKLPNGNLLGTVAVSGNTVIASAPSETIGSNQYQGALYVFVKPKSGWRNGLTPIARLTASDGQPKDFLGYALTANNDTVVATATPRAAYLFLKPAGGWVTATQTDEFDAPLNSGGFGYSAAVNNKGSFVIGAPEAGFNEDYYGAAFIYASPGGEIMASNPSYYNFFGASVAISGNLIVIGANGVDVGENQYEGAAYVFQGTTQIAELTPTPGIANEEMGWSVAVDGSTLAASAVYATVGSNAEQGEIYIFGP